MQAYTRSLWDIYLWADWEHGNDSFCDGGDTGIGDTVWDVAPGY